MGARHYMKSLAALFVAALLLAPAAVVSAAPAADSRPNVLFILTDQQHAGMMSCAGNSWLKTPAMDSMAPRFVKRRMR